MCEKTVKVMLPLLLTLILAVIICPLKTEAAQVDTAFTYQGQLLEAGSPANGSYDFQFSLYDAESGGTQAGITISQNLTVSNAYFYTSLDFGTGVFDGTAFWLETAVSPAGAGSYTTLSPRQPLNPAPYALCAVSVVDGAITPAKINAGGSSNGQALTSNGNTPVWGYPDKLSANGSVALQVVPSNDETHPIPNVIGGTGNTCGSYGVTISGGNSNEANIYPYATVGGGDLNKATGWYATVPGGHINTASGSGSFAVGSQNIAEGDYSAAIGIVAKARGDYSVAIGNNVTASGDYSIALGYGANTNGKEGAFVLGDHTSGSTLQASDDNQFTARFTNGYRLYTNSGNSVTLAPGGGGWAAASDRALKENFAAVSPEEILQKLAAVPVQTWNYKGQDDSIRHIGPVAQDFYAAFGVGEDDKHINTIDADGVALISIQSLYQMLQEKDSQIQSNQAQIQDLQKRLEALEKAAGH